MSTQPNQSISTCLSTIAVSCDVLKRLTEICLSPSGMQELVSLRSLMAARISLINGAMDTLLIHEKKLINELLEAKNSMAQQLESTSNPSPQKSAEPAPSNVRADQSKPDARELIFKTEQEYQDWLKT